MQNKVKTSMVKVITRPNIAINVEAYHRRLPVEFYLDFMIG